MDDDDEPGMECIIRYVPPVPRKELNAAQQVLRTVNPFVPGVFFHDPYEVTTYLPRQSIYGEEYCLLVDRNVVTRWVGLVRGSNAADNHRIAAAIMLFAQAADLRVDPSFAFYEIAQSSSPDELNTEIDQFFTAEEAEPEAWSSIALGRATHLTLPEPESRRPRPAYDLSAPLYIWQRSYVLALKIAELNLEGGAPEKLMMRLIDWMYYDYLMGGVGVQLASYYFAPGAPKKRLLKWIRHADREKALRGIRNAAWDLTLISEWLHRVRPESDPPGSERRWILCSLDAAVRRMAQNAISFEARDETTFLRQTLAKVWRPSTAARIADRLHECSLDLKAPTRYLNQDPEAKAMGNFIASGEEFIRRWSPRKAGASVRQGA